MFHFSLQTVLDVRERFKKIKNKEYTTELMAHHQLELRMKALQSQLAEGDRSMAITSTTSHSPVPMQLHGNYRKRLQSEMEILAGHLKEQYEAMDVKRQELVEARRAHRALEILREKEHQRYLLEEERKERTTYDEIATNYHMFRK